LAERKIRRWPQTEGESMDTEILKQCKLFDNLPEEDIAKLVEVAKTVDIPAGKSVISEHALGDSLFIIVKGKVEINKAMEKGEPNMLAQLKTMEAGEFFGEMSLIDNEPRSATVIAREDVQLLVIPKERFLTIAYSNPRVLFNLIRALSWRLRDSNLKFAELMEKLIAQNRLMAVGMAASKIIHDIKTPLSIIVLTAEIIRKLYPESLEFSDSIVKQTRLIDQMVREILDFAKGKATPANPQKVNLNAFFQDLKDTFGQTLVGRDIEFIIENKVNREVWFDEGKLRRVLINLMKNSSEAMTINAYIRLDARLEDDTLLLVVSDNGPGIPEHIKANLYSPFQSEGKTLGTGLGLAITQKLVHEHNGTIEYRPNEPQGTIFFIRLPQKDMK
jgi:signal transduction histidine kinase